MSSSSVQLPDAGSKQVVDRTEKPQGVISKRAQQYVFVGIAVAIILVSMFSSNRQPKPPAKNDAAKIPLLQESNERKVADYRAELNEQQKAADKARLAQSAMSSAVSQPVAGAANGGGGQADRHPGQNSYGDESNSQPDPLEQRERERTYNARFASNLAFAALEPRNASVASSGRGDTGEPEPNRTQSAQPPNGNESAAQTKKSATVEVNQATGPPYVLFEGTLIETTLVNRLDGDFSGPAKVMVTNPVFSHDRQHVLIPEGTFILGEVKRIQGFGQRRLAVVFHRLLMPDGYSVDLDQFQGLNQIGETGLKDQVNNHYLQIFGASIALGLISGAAEGSIGTVGIGESGSEAYRAGVSSSLSQSSTRVLDRFLNINPTLTIREGQRIKVYLTNDLLLPAYENHTVMPNI
jgi:type IV secretory pathway VirB10-like protein